MSKYIKLGDALKAVRDNTMPLDCGHIDRMRAIVDLPTIEVSEDCISREYILGEAFASDEYNRETKSFDLPVVSVSDIVNAPSVVPSCQKNRQVERAEGEWEITEAYPHNVYCSECHKKFAQTHWAVWEDGSLPRNYCPNCGAKMKGADE